MSARGLRRLPVRVRLVAGFAAGMLLVLTAAGGFVYWRVRYALDLRLNEDLAAQSAQLQSALRNASPANALQALPGLTSETQVLDATGAVVARGPAAGPPLLTPVQSAAAATGPLRTSRGSVLPGRRQHLRILATPAPGGLVAVSVVRLDQRDEALRELLAQLAIANLTALLVASTVGYRLAQAALGPVEAYRSRAAQIAGGATGVRLTVPDGPDDEVRRLGLTLNEMLAVQELAAERQRQFVDDASHELRTPLALLAGEVELALRRPRSAAELEDALRRVGQDTGRLIALTDDLLTLGAQDSASAVHEAVDLALLIAAAAERTRALLPAGSGRAVRTEVLDGLTVSGDPTLLARALGNLADNAVHHGAGAVQLGGRSAPAAVVLTVHDAGGGISADFLPRATNRFARGAAPGHAGSGLGLALVAAIVTAHHGQLRLCSGSVHHREPASPALDALPCHHPDDGSTATLLLPLPQEPSGR